MERKSRRTSARFRNGAEARPLPGGPDPGMPQTPEILEPANAAVLSHPYSDIVVRCPMGCPTPCRERAAVPRKLIGKKIHESTRRSPFTGTWASPGAGPNAIAWRRRAGARCRWRALRSPCRDRRPGSSSRPEGGVGADARPGSLSRDAPRRVRKAVHPGADRDVVWPGGSGRTGHRPLGARPPVKPWTPRALLRARGGRPPEEMKVLAGTGLETSAALFYIPTPRRGWCGDRRRDAG